jgi:hypothetical protein
VRHESGEVFDLLESILFEQSSLDLEPGELGEGELAVLAQVRRRELVNERVPLLEDFRERVGVE